MNWIRKKKKKKNQKTQYNAFKKILSDFPAL